MSQADTHEIDSLDAHVDEEIRHCLSLEKPKSFFLFAGAGSGKTRSLVNALDYIRSNYGTTLRRRAQRVAVITYTKAARDEIIRRTQFDPLIAVSTIHSFAWTLIDGFNHDIREWLRVELKNDIVELTEKERKGRKNTQASADRLADITSKQRRLDRLESIRCFVYSPDSDNQGRDSLNHAEVLKIAGDFVRNKSSLRQIIRDGYPFVLVDESQDTNKHIVDALFALQRAHRGEIVVGLFGDMMQRIYGDGQAGLGESLPPDWVTPTKQLNFRCPRRVIKLINKVREASDKQVQTPCSSAIEGHVRMFVLLSEGTNKRQAEAEIATYMAMVTGDPEWTADNGVKTLILEHRMAALRMGFDGLLAALHPVSQFRTGLLDRTLPLVTFFSNLILPLLKAKEDKFAIARIVREASPLASVDALKAAGGVKQLDEVQLAVNTLIALLSGEKPPTFRDVAENVKMSGLFTLPEILRVALDRDHVETSPPQPDDDEPENKRTDRNTAVDAFLNVSFGEIAPYVEYVGRNARFDTHQGVKGLEFPRVMVVMDDKEARGFQFKYEKIFDASLTEDATTSATRRLLYVTCSRAEHSLALVAYTNDPNRVKSYVIDQGWFQPDEVHLEIPQLK
jgi:DNA helicase-2/ATP-dependent DNA helicase PcrA